MKAELSEWLLIRLLKSTINMRCRVKVTVFDYTLVYLYAVNDVIEFRMIRLFLDTLNERLENEYKFGSIEIEEIK